MKMFFAIFGMMVVIVAMRAVGDNSYERNLGGEYWLSAIDARDEMSILNSDGEGIVRATVYALGQNEHFIAAKQHPNGERKETNYYIISVDDGKVYGPMAEEEEYKRKKNELHTGDLDFKLVFSDLE